MCIRADLVHFFVIRSNNLKKNWYVYFHSVVILAFFLITEILIAIIVIKKVLYKTFKGWFLSRLPPEKLEKSIDAHSFLFWFKLCQYEVLEWI